MVIFCPDLSKRQDLHGNGLRNSPSGYSQSRITRKKQDLLSRSLIMTFSSLFPVIMAGLILTFASVQTGTNDIDRDPSINVSVFSFSKEQWAVLLAFYTAVLTIRLSTIFLPICHGIICVKPSQLLKNSVEIDKFLIMKLAHGSHAEK